MTIARQKTIKVARDLRDLMLGYEKRGLSTLSIDETTEYYMLSAAKILVNKAVASMYT